MVRADFHDLISFSLAMAWARLVCSSDQTSVQGPFFRVNFPTALSVRFPLGRAADRWQGMTMVDATIYRPDSLFDLRHCPAAELFEGLEYGWEVLARLSAWLERHAPEGGATRSGVTVMPGAYLGPRVVLGEGTVVEPGAVLMGPAWIGRGCLVRAGCYVRENVIVGDKAILGNSSEFKNCILFDACEVPHFNYVGDAVLGHHAHLGAGAILSNFRLDHAAIRIRQTDGSLLDTGLEKFSALVGDFCEIGSNSVISPGSVLGRRTMLYPGTHWQGVLEAERIVKVRQSRQVVVRVDGKR